MPQAINTAVDFDRAAAVTPSDATVFEPSKILVQTAGTITVQPAGNPVGSTIQLTATNGQVLPGLYSMVLATGTAATGIFRFF